MKGHHDPTDSRLTRVRVTNLIEAKNIIFLLAETQDYFAEDLRGNSIVTNNTYH